MPPSYDLMLLHPPAVYDFRRKPLFPGALGTTVEDIQFIKVPIGMLSIAEYLDRHGFKVILDNIGDRMISNPGFDVEKHLADSRTKIFAVGLHFQQHAQGAMEIAKLCKKLHPGAIVILGGLTATCFAKEIIKKYDFIDGVIRGEAEKPLLELVRSVETHGKLTATPNLVYRSETGKIISSPLMAASRSIDEFEYTRFDLIEPNTSIYPAEASHRWSLEVCRGCVYNCAICGGSAYTYKKYLGIKKPAFRSPEKIVRDMKRLNDQGIRFIGLFQDARMAGKAYWQELMRSIAKEKPEIDRLSLDILVPADEEFIEAIAKIGRRVILHLCPDTGSNAVRKRLGRHYSNEKLLETIRICHKYRIPVTNFFSVGLAGETEAEMKETWELWEQLSALDYEAQAKGAFADIEDTVPIGGPILGPIVIDPGSRAFDAPEEYGYKLLYPDLETYIHGLSQPAWHQWLNYETLLLNKEAMVDLILKSIEFTIDQRERFGFIDSGKANSERARLEADRLIVREINKIMKLENPRERTFRIITLRRNLDALRG